MFRYAKLEGTLTLKPEKTMGFPGISGFSALKQLTRRASESKGRQPELLYVIRKYHALFFSSGGAFGIYECLPYPDGIPEPLSYTRESSHIRESPPPCIRDTANTQPSAIRETIHSILTVRYTSSLDSIALL
jgi:hypothetical protein